MAIGGRVFRRAAGKTLRACVLVAAASVCLLLLSQIGSVAWTGSAHPSSCLAPTTASHHSRIPCGATDTLNRLVSEAAERTQAKQEKEKFAAEQQLLPADKKLPPTPVVYQLPEVFRRLMAAHESPRPGHVVQRRWLSKGKKQGYVSVPFSSAVPKVLKEESQVNICLVGRRERSDEISKAWQKLFDDDDIDPFDISGEADCPHDLDPVEPAWKYKLFELPSEDEILSDLKTDRTRQRMEESFYHRTAQNLKRRAQEIEENDLPCAKVLRQVIAGLPEDIVEDKSSRELVRSTVHELLRLLWTTHAATGATRLKWRFAMTDADLEPTAPQASMSNPFGVRAYLVLAGQGLEFVASKHIDPEKVEVAKILSEEQLGRMSGEDWAATVAKDGTNLTDALKRVPAGWTTLFKGDGWPEVPGTAMHRLPQSARRLFFEVEAEEVPRDEDSDRDSGSEETNEKSSKDKGSSRSSWLGPLAGAAVALFELARKTPPFAAGQKSRKEIDAFMRGLQRVPEPDALARAEEAMSRLEQRSWRANFGQTDEAPSVLVIGGQSPTGQVVCQKLVMRGYHVTLLSEAMREKRVLKELPQGATLSSVRAKTGTDPTCKWNIPDDIYDAVSGIDKMVIVDCDDSDANAELASLTHQGVKNVLATWLMYRSDFAEGQRSYTSKVQIFNFDRDTDFEVWDLERKNPSDTCYGNQRVGWVRSDKSNMAMCIGGFYEPVAQCTLACPQLKLNLKRFSGLILHAYNQAFDNMYSFFLRTTDFETSRIQYEFNFECKASTWHNVCMPFNAFRPVRCDGMELPEGSEEAERPLDRADVVQMGIVMRTTGEHTEVAYGERICPFSLHMDFIKVFRTQQEPQVVYLGREFGEKASEAAPAEDEEEEEFFSGDDEFMEKYNQMKEAEAEAAAEIQQLVRVEDPLEIEPNVDAEGSMQFLKGNPKTAAQAVIETGLAYSLIKVNGLNEHPGGKFPVSIKQASVKRPPLSVQSTDLGTISRGDAAELVVSALMEPSCVNAEIAAGEPPRGGSGGTSRPQDAQLISSSFEIGSTMQEDVKNYLKQLTPNS